MRTMRTICRGAARWASRYAIPKTPACNHPTMEVGALSGPNATRPDPAHIRQLQTTTVCPLSISPRLRNCFEDPKEWLRSRGPAVPFRARGRGGVLTLDVIPAKRESPFRKPDLVLRQAQDEVLRGDRAPSGGTNAPSVDLMVSLSNHEVVARFRRNDAVVGAKSKRGAGARGRVSARCRR